MVKKWIQSALKNHSRGALHRQLGIIIVILLILGTVGGLFYYNTKQTAFAEKNNIKTDDFLQKIVYHSGNGGNPIEQNPVIINNPNTCFGEITYACLSYNNNQTACELVPGCFWIGIGMCMGGVSQTCSQQTDMAICDLMGCDKTYVEPVLANCSDGIQNQNETGIDCR